MPFFPFIRPVLVLACCCMLTPLSGQVTPANDGKAATEGSAGKLATLLADAQSLQQYKRYFDALAKLDEAEQIDPKRAEIYNTRGAIYLAMPARDEKDLNKAREQFAKASALRPDDMPPYFNLAEVEFVSGKWPEAERAFDNILAKFPKLPNPLHHLVLFKKLVTLTKQDKLAEAEKLLTGHFSFMDDTPAYYFGKAAIAWQKKDAATGNQWLAKGRLIFKPQDASPYLDSLAEAHYIDSLSVARPDETAEPAKP